MVVLSNLIKGPFLKCEVKNEGIIALDWHEILKRVLWLLTEYRRKNEKSIRDWNSLIATPEKKKTCWLYTMTRMAHFYLNLDEESVKKHATTMCKHRYLGVSIHTNFYACVPFIILLELVVLRLSRWTTSFN